MQVGIITVDGIPCGVVLETEGTPDTFMPNLDGYVPEGRAGQGKPHAGSHHYVGHHHGAGAPHEAPIDHDVVDQAARAGVDIGDAPPKQRENVYHGSRETESAIIDAAKAHHLDPDTMRAIASIESGMNPQSNASNERRYKGLYQMGREEWERFGNGGDIYNAHDNAMAAARMFEANRNRFKERFGRDPTDTEMYMMHQQGLGFYTNGAMTNIAGNPYPGMRGPQTHESFEAGWGREVARRKGQFGGQSSSNPSGAPQAILDQARKVALDGGAGAVRKFMAENGYPMDGNWCGEFAADVVKSAGGVPPQHPEVASNWRNWGAPTNDPQPGDIAVRRGTPTGSTGSHVTIVEGADAKSGTFTGLGGNQGAWERTFRANQYEFRRGADGAAGTNRTESTPDPASEVPYMVGLRRTKEQREEHYRPDPATEPPVP